MSVRASMTSLNEVGAVAGDMMPTHTITQLVYHRARRNVLLVVCARQIMFVDTSTTSALAVVTLDRHANPFVMVCVCAAAVCANEHA
jgi:hypothetical protein